MKHLRTRKDLLIAFMIAIFIHVIAGMATGTLLYIHSAGFEPVYDISFSNVDVSYAEAPPMQIKTVSKDQTPAPVIPLQKRDCDPAPLITSPKPPQESTPIPKPQTAQIGTSTAASHIETDVGLSNDNIPNSIDISQMDPNEIGRSIIRPKYPLEARRRGEEGSVTINITVNSSGKAENVELLQTSGYSSLDESAISAAKKALYVNSDSEEFMTGEARITIRFKLLPDSR
jgi:TonB family protein